MGVESSATEDKTHFSALNQEFQTNGPLASTGSSGSVLGRSVAGWENPVGSKGCHVVTIYVLHCVFVFMFLEWQPFQLISHHKANNFSVNIKFKKNKTILFKLKSYMTIK